MFRQYRNKIIALFVTVCLLVTSLCVSVGAADNSATMLYGGIELPALSMLDTYPYVVLDDDGDGGFTAFCSETPLYLKWNSDGDERLLYMDVPCAYYFYDPGQYDDNGMSWRKDITNQNWGGTYLKYVTLVWANHDVVDTTNGTVYLLGTNAVSVGGSSSAVTDATFTIESVQALDDSASVVYTVDGLGSADAIYTVKSSLMQDGLEIRSTTSEPFAGTSAYFHNTLANLTPETEYTLTYTLLENGVETAVTASETFTTLAVEEETPVDETETLSLLSAILAAINDQNDRQEREYTSIIDTLGMLWLRLRYIEENTAALAPSEQEAALKESTKETTQAVNDALFAEDAPTKVTVDDVAGVGQVGSAAAQMFDSGVGVGDFFNALNNVGFIAFFSQETYDDLNTVQSAATYSFGNESGVVDYYGDNLSKIQQFVGGE